MNQETLDKFRSETGIDLMVLLQRFVTFQEASAPAISAYYAGTLREAPSRHFTALEAVRQEVREAIGAMARHKESFSDYADWEVLEMLEGIQTGLSTLANAARFMRSSTRKGSYGSLPEARITQTQGQTLEQLHEATGGRDPQNGWTDMALTNDLREEDYTMQGGTMLRAKVSERFEPIRCVLDTMSPETMLGRDVLRKLTIEGGDLKILSPSETFSQSADILANMRKGDNPEFPDHGKSAAFAVGSNIGSITFPSVFREMYETFANDDTVASFAITDVRMKGNSLSISYEVEPRVGTALEKEISF